MSAYMLVQSIEHPEQLGRLEYHVINAEILSVQIQRHSIDNCVQRPLLPPYSVQIV